MLNRQAWGKIMKVYRKPELVKAGKLGQITAKPIDSGILR